MNILSLARHVTRSSRGRRPHAVVLYGKPGCHLCDDARTLLQRLGRRYTLTVREIDITTDAALYRQYDIVIPVIVLDGVHRLEAPIREGDLRALLNYDATE